MKQIKISVNKLPLNILFKGVPGVGKSRTIDDIINKYIYVDDKEIERLSNGKQISQVLRINIHSGSNNSDLMQGIGISINNNNEIRYSEKTGLVLRLVLDAIRFPNIKFAVVLEEIQENSLNEIIGDLIYLIENDKRTDLTKYNLNWMGMEDDELFDCIESLIKRDKGIHHVTMPLLIENRSGFKKLLLPKNIYFFCSSNYREDRKIIEDNLLRRFEVVDIFPNYKLNYKSNDISTFLEKLNEAILEEFMNYEIHPDRYLIGHSMWMNVTNKSEFYKAILKMIIEFKEIREIEYSRFSNIINITIKRLEDNINLEDDVITKDDLKKLCNKKNYLLLVRHVRGLCGYSFFGELDE